MSTALDAYMTRHGIENAAFAARINRDRTIVSKLRRGVLRPTLDVAAAIETATGGDLPMQVWVSGLAPIDHDASDTAAPQQASPGKIEDNFREARA